MSQWLERYKIVIAIFLLILIASGGVVLFQKHPWAKEPLEITLTSRNTSMPIVGAEVYVDGAVMSPGWYPLEDGDGFSDAIMAAGGLRSDADPERVKLYVYQTDESTEPQKISINRADAWLLDALPGIGPALAQNIIQYREDNGPFESIEELMRVPGIGQAKYDGLKELITVE